MKTKLLMSISENTCSLEAMFTQWNQCFNYDLKLVGIFRALTFLNCRLVLDQCLKINVARGSQATITFRKKIRNSSFQLA